MVVTLQGLDKEMVERKPDRSAPIRIAAEHAGRRLAGFVVHAVTFASDIDPVRVVFMETRDGTDAIRREKFLLVEHVGEHAAQAIGRRNGQ